MVCIAGSIASGASSASSERSGAPGNTARQMPGGPSCGILKTAAQFTWPEQFELPSTLYVFARHGFAMNSYISAPVNWAAVFKMPHDGPPGIWRAVFPGAPDLSDEALLAPEAIEPAMQTIVPRTGAYEIRYKSVYRVHQRVAKTFRVGRVLIAGDAAHLNNPMGGLGLNSGVHDAINLAGKLGRVWRGEAGDELLDLYVRQRRSATVEQVQAMSI